MKRIKLGQIGIGHNHGEGKMLAARKFPELFEIVGYAEENERWIYEFVCSHFVIKTVCKYRCGLTR